MAEEASHWSDGRAMFASGSPFPPVEIGSREHVIDENLAVGLIYPPQSSILDVSLHVAERIATYIFDRGPARLSQPPEIGALIRSRIYGPVYAG